MKKNIFLISTLLMSLCWSCKEGEIINQTPSNFSSNVLKDEAVDGEIELGLKKEDPNSLKNAN